MIKRSRQIMMIVLLLMLLQFFTPFILPVVAHELANIKETAYQIQHNSVATPLLLNEKDERELDAKAIGNNQIPLLDLTIHSLNLQASHSGKTYYFHTEMLYRGSPPLFAVLQTFLI
jgi:hypothetical protein